MSIEATAGAALTVEFETEAELRAEQRANLAVGGLMVRTAARFAPLSTIDLTLRLAGGACPRSQDSGVRMACAPAFVVSADTAKAAAARTSDPFGRGFLRVSPR